MIWFLLAMMVVSFLVSAFLTPSPDTENAKAGKFEADRFPKAEEGAPPALVLGTVRLKGPNTIWFGNGKTEKIREKVKTGMFSSKKVTVGYKYYIGMDIAICLGFGVVLKKIFAGKYTLWEGTRSTSGQFWVEKQNLFGGEKEKGGMQGNITFYCGNATETQNTYLRNVLGANVPAYHGISRCVFHQFYVGTQPTLEALNFEVQRLPNAMSIPDGKHIVNTYDLNPVEALYQIMVAGYGGMKLDPGVVETVSWLAAAEVLHTEGNGFSFILDRSNSGKEIVEEVLRQIDGVMYQDPTTSKIVLKLIRDDYVIDELQVFDETNIVEIKDWTKGSWTETFNQVRVHYVKRNKNYGEGVAMQQDMGNINWAGKLRSTDVSFPGCYNNDLANKLATRELSTLNVPFFRCRLVLTRQAATLRPGDAFVLSWPEYRIEQIVMRVQKFDLGELTNGRIVIDCIQDKFGLSETVYLSPDDGLWVPEERIPSPIISYKNLEAPVHYLTLAGLPAVKGEAYLLSVAVNPSSATSQAYSAYFSEVVGFDPYYEGLLEVDYPLTAALTSNWDGGRSSGLSTSLVVGTVSNVEALVAFSDADVKLGGGLALIDDEIVGVTGVVDNFDTTYTLTVRRGLMDTKMVPHLAGAVMYWLDGANPLHVVAAAAGTPTVPVNSYVRLGDSVSDSAASVGELANLTLSCASRSSRPTPPDYITIAGLREPTTVSGPSITVAWRNRVTSSIRFVDDATDTLPGTVEVVIRWRINAGAWTTVVSTGTSVSIVPGAVGTLDVEVFTREVADPTYESWTRESHTCTVT